MDNNKDYYKVLEVSRNSTLDEIKTSYRKLAKKFHPDLHRDNSLTDLANEKFKEINEAYEVIGDEKKRKEYDLMMNKGSSSYSASSDNTSETKTSYKNTYKDNSYDTRYSNEENRSSSNNANTQRTKSNGDWKKYQNESEQKKRSSTQYGQTDKIDCCYFHKKSEPITKCQMCGVPLCVDCATSFEAPICLNCLFENNDLYLKRLRLPLYVTILSIIFGLILGIIMGIKIGPYNDFGILEGMLFTIYLEGVWLYLHYYGDTFKRFIYKIITFFDLSSDVVRGTMFFTNILISLSLGWLLGISFGAHKLYKGYKSYKEFLPQYKETKKYIKEKFGVEKI